MNSLYKDIAESTHNKFQSHYQLKFKKKYCIKTNYTVIASIGVIQKENSQFNILSVCSGTKTIPYSVLKNHKQNILRDMHAQILCIRAFRQLMNNFLMKKYHMQLFCYNQKKKKYYFNKQKYAIFLYVSEPFCGDCSINQNQNMFSGARPLKFYNQKICPNQKYQKNILRTKPGRLDLPIQKRCLSLSCSDKLAMYNLVGIQGKHMFKYFMPIYIDHFIVNTATLNQNSIQNGLNYIERISQLSNLRKQTVQRKIFNILVLQKQRKISNQFKANIPNIVCIQPNKNVNIQDKQGFQLTLISTQVVKEWINGKTGLFEGSSLKNYQKKGKKSSFSSCQLYKQVKNQDQSQKFKYCAIKQRVKKLFKISTDNFK